MKRVFFLVVTVVLTAVSCTSSSDFEKAKKHLEAQGYTHIQKTGYKLWCCSENDAFKTGFRAVSAAGDTVEGCACSSLVKGVTIRFK